MSMNPTDFVTLINPFKDKVFRLAKRLLASNEEAEDASQEVLLKLWNSKKSLNNYNNLEAFAMTVTKNYCLDQLKSKRASNLHIEHENYLDHETNVLQKIEDTDSVSWIEKIIAKLPEQQKIIIQLRDIENYDYKKIAELLDMNETAIRVALSRARKTIKEEMNKTHSYGIQ
jgi:RNA polymerase sigma factor (sigma-70 family)